LSLKEFHTDLNDSVVNIEKIEQYMFHPKENHVEYYSNHRIYTNDERIPKSRIINQRKTLSK